MGPDTIFVFALVGVASVLFASGRVRLDIVALLVVLGLCLSGVLTVSESLAGFGDPVVILVACLLVIGEMISRTGIAYMIGDWLTRTGGNSETRLLVLLMITAVGLGAFMSSTAVVAIFIPIVLNISTKSDLNASRLLMPLSYGALISGMVTLIATTPNLVVSAELAYAGYEPFSFFSMTPIGLAVLVVAVLYMLTVGRRLLPGGSVSPPASPGQTVADLLAEYGARNEIHRVLVPPSSQLVGQTLGEAELATRYHVRVLLLLREEQFRTTVNSAPGHDTVIRAGDTLIAHASESAVAKLAHEVDLDEGPAEDRHRAAWMRESGVATVLVHPQSQLIGTTLREAAFRTRYGIEILAIKRNGERLEQFLDEPLAFADSLLVAGPWTKLGRLQVSTHDFVVLSLPVERHQIAPAYRLAPVALLILVSMVLLSAFKIVPVVVAVLMAALAAVFTRCLTMEDAYRAIHWSSIVLIAGMLPIADALAKTGGIDLIVGGLVTGFGASSPYVMMSVVFFLSAVLGLFLSNTATAVLMAPIAISVAEAMEVAPYPFAMVVAIAASAAFVTPVSTPVVTLVVDPGKYRFVDFVKVGMPLLVLTWLVTIVVTPLFFAF